MTPEDRNRFPSQTVTLADGRVVAIRTLAAGDGPALADFYAAVPLADIRFYCPYPLTREQAFRNAAQADSPLAVVLVMETADGAIGGYAWCRWPGPDAEESVFGICIRPDFRRQGAGRVLMTRLLEIAGAVGPPVMALTVQLANRAAVALYRRMGFAVVREQMREHRPEYGFPPEPEYVMERTVRCGAASSRGFCL